MRGRARSGALLAALPAVLALWIAPSASAIGVSGTATPTNLQAGANSDFNIHVGFSTATDQVKNLTIALPPGLIGDPSATPLCTVAQLNANNCPPNTAVGTVSTSASVTLLEVPLPPVGGTLYNLVPQPGEPARFGIVLVPPLGGILLQNIILQSGVQLRPGDFGLNTVINNIPFTVDTTLGLGVPINITAMDVSLNGTAGAPPKPFMRNPTYCTPATTRFIATSYSGSTTTNPATGQTSFSATGCGALPFAPRFSAQIGPLDPGANSTKAPVTTTIEQGNGEAGLKIAKVFLPPGLGPDLAVLGINCAPAEFASSSCPPASLVGQAVATSPILPQPLTGPLALVSNGTGVPDLGLDLKGPLAIKLTGKFLTAPTNGVEFAGLPDIPISRFQLAFAGGPGGLLTANKTLCDIPTPTFDTSFDSYSGVHRGGPVTPSITGCGPGGPTAKLKLRKRDSRHPRLKLEVNAGGSPLRKLRLKLPKQLRLGKRGIRAKALYGTLPKRALKARKRTLKISESEGDGSLTIRSGKRGLTRTGKLPRRPRFRLKLQDAAGTVTTLKLRPGK